jgi:hypothetical protein
MYCNLCGKAIERSTPESRSDAPPAKEKTLVLPGPFSSAIYTKSQLYMRIVFEVVIALACIIGGFYFGQPVYGILLGVMALGVGYVIYLFSTEAS